MIKRTQEQDRDSIVGKLARFGRGRGVQSEQPTRSTVYPVPPSRRHRKAVTTWQDEVALRQREHVASETGISQQALLAEGINYVLVKYGKAAVAT